MPEYKYVSDSDNGSGQGGVTVQTGFDTEQFGDLELLGTLMQFKEQNVTFWDKIGVGGSICSTPTVKKGRCSSGDVTGISIR